MTRLIRTEWLKLATTRGPWAVIAGVLALTALITPFAMADIGQGDASRAADAREALAIGPGFITALMLLLIGALAAAGEFHHRSIVSTYLITPRRGRILAAKLIAHATLGAVVAAIGVAIAFPIVLLMARGEHLTVASNGAPRRASRARWSQPARWRRCAAWPPGRSSVTRRPRSS